MLMKSVWRTLSRAIEAPLLHPFITAFIVVPLLAFTLAWLHMNFGLPTPWPDRATAGLTNCVAYRERGQSVSGLQANYDSHTKRWTPVFSASEQGGPSYLLPVTKQRQWLRWGYNELRYTVLSAPDEMPQRIRAECADLATYSLMTYRAWPDHIEVDSQESGTKPAFISGFMLFISPIVAALIYTGGVRAWRKNSALQRVADRARREAAAAQPRPAASLSASDVFGSWGAGSVNVTRQADGTRTLDIQVSEVYKPEPPPWTLKALLAIGICGALAAVGVWFLVGPGISAIIAGEFELCAGGHCTVMRGVQAVMMAGGHTLLGLVLMLMPLAAIRSRQRLDRSNMAPRERIWRHLLKHGSFEGVFAEPKMTILEWVCVTGVLAGLGLCLVAAGWGIVRTW